MSNSLNIPTYKTSDNFELPATSCLEDLSWSQISAISLSGRAPSIFHVGQEKKITLSTGESVTAVILGFNHDDFMYGGKLGITFGLKNCLESEDSMNFSSTNNGGWSSSGMRSKMSTYKSYLPSELQTAIRPAYKHTGTGSHSLTTSSTTDDLFLFSYVEIFGTNYRNQGNGAIQLTAAEEGKQYEYYKGKTWCSYYGKTTVDSFGTPVEYVANYYYQENSYKGLGDTATYASDWWLRSPALNGTDFCYVDKYSGSAKSQGASTASGVSFGFCV